MYKTNTRSSSGLSKPSIITLPLDVTRTLCVSEKLIWCLGGERHFKIILRAEPSCRPAEAFSTPFAPAQQASNLTFERISRIVPSSLSLSRSKSERRPPSEKQLPRTRARRTARLGARTQRGNRRRRGRKAGVWGGGRGGGGCRRSGREEEDYLHMHEAPSTALFPGSCSGGSGGGRGCGGEERGAGEAARATAEAYAGSGNGRGDLHGAW